MVVLAFGREVHVATLALAVGPAAGPRLLAVSRRGRGGVRSRSRTQATPCEIGGVGGLLTS